MNAPKRPQRPPRWADYLLEWFCAPNLLEEVQGDLQERFERDIRQRGITSANRNYVLSVLGFLRSFARQRQPNAYRSPESLRQTDQTVPFLLSPVMLRNHFKIAWRNLINNKAYSAINIFGLAVGLATCLLITLYVFDELSYDKHHENANRLYRVATATKEENWAATAAPTAWGLKNDFPEVEQVTRILKMPNMEKMLLKYDHNHEQKHFFETNGYYVDSTFFELFTYKFKYGNPKNAINQPNTLVLSESLANKLFGDENPIGKVINLGLPFGDFNYTVNGVFRKSHKSHIDAHFFLSMRNGDVGSWVDQQRNWATNNIFYAYVKLRAGANAQSFERKLPDFLNRHGAADLRALGVSKSLFLQPVTDIYLKSSLDNEIAPGGSMTYLYVFGSIAAFLLLIACINFMNLSTARSEKRAKEVGIRKAMGAFKTSLIGQFLGESLLMSILALCFALAFMQLILPVFNDLTRKDLSVFQNPAFLGWIVAITLLTGLLAGFYPAFYLSSFKPIAVLKGRLITTISATALRKGLVVFQFTVSIVLILGAIVIWQQLSFVQNQNLGFTKTQQLVIPLQSSQATGNYITLKNELLKNPQVVSAASGSTYPGLEASDDLLFYAEGKSVHEAVDINFATVENDYLETLGFKLLYGRAFSKNFTADSTSIILNEVAVNQLGYDAKTAVGKSIYFDWQNGRHPMQIVGVVRNFNYQSLHQAIKPYGLTTTIGDKHRYFIANVHPKEYTKLLATIEKSWKKVNPDTPFSYSFLDQDFQRNYEKEQRTSSIVLYFTLIAIVIACLGLFGLVAFSAEQRTKEIGIRKVLGASVVSIVALLSKDFLQLILVAILIATPIAWYGMTQWLHDFAYKVDIEWWVFALAGLLALGTALLTVSFQSIKAALMNPVTSLRSD
ncbi:ABC transporter permease [Spirosoma endbachense]|nr:ABC transporter permease [Spirosoma endbachense]